MWCIPNITLEFIERMLDVLEVYERPYNPLLPVVCMDEKSKQLLEDTKNRTPLPMRPGKAKRADYEYKRNGTANLFVAVEPKAGKRIVRVTKRRTKKDYASFIKFLVLAVYKKATKVVLVEDNLNTHSKDVLIEALGEEGRKIADKIEWRFTPKHASWLNQAEIEIHSLEQQCLNRRIADFHTMQSEVAACVKKRNKDKCKINWQFTREEAEKKFNLS